MTQRRPPTSRDVAKASGVSQPTVSYVLNHTPGHRISIATRKRVVEAAADLGYEPSRAAQTLRQGRSKIIILNSRPAPAVATDADFFGELSRRLETAGWTLLSHFSPAGGDNLPHLLRLIDATQAEAVLDFSADPDTLDALRQRGIPVVPLIPAEQWRLAILGPVEHQFSHLIQMGHTQLVVVSPDTTDESMVVVERRGRIRALAAEIELPEPIMVNWTGDLGALGAALEVAFEGGATGTICHNDDTAIPTLAALHGRGLRVPEDVAVVGVDDSPQALMTIPALTSVGFEVTSDLLAQSAGFVLGSLGEGEQDFRVVPLTFSLVARESTRPLGAVDDARPRS